MKPLITVEYRQVGDDGYLATIIKQKEHTEDTVPWMEDVIINEFFADDWNVLLDRVLFRLAEMKFHE